ncbi:MAG: Zn-ribbon containing protein [Halodesulfurarchaeum sp.]|nr:Zn-ribbon containing protein [Halodesulfurarchaeum sp.]
MPHQCTNCTSVFPDGSKEMLSGCPHCGGNTFQYIPKGADPEQYEPESNEPPDPPIAEDSVTGKVGRAASTVKEYVSARRDDESANGKVPGESAPVDDVPDTGAETSSSSDEGERSLEDRAQSAARGEVADMSDLSSGAASETTPSETTGDDTKQTPTDSAADTGASETPQPESAHPPREDARVVDEPNEAATTDLETLRAELNDQFESIRIVEPGQYELNLMELYDREEHIIALREDGKYKIEVPDSWREGDERP